MGLGTEFGTIEREIHIEASPDIVYRVVSEPEHLSQWWPDEAELEPSTGGTGRISFVRPEGTKLEALTVVEADPPRRFAFRWTYDDGLVAAPDNSLLVTFDLVAVGSGTLLRFSEQGFRERGWEAAVPEEAYRDHTSGWDYFLPRLEAYAGRVAAAR
ncbi:SRPBCC family protein [Nocardioides agariphilus]|uniref:SRPBCC family protein n=1 Tax=Nocardioides agariphilus TaxID=433664 RepID=A0A930YP05_9ACTN|nr:SRPBCC family protein [Nocardioides agariphilus]MBF4767250.1 SRPBCC family protein [Nocardioides agariphilus]